MQGPSQVYHHPLPPKSLMRCFASVCGDALSEAKGDFTSEMCTAAEALEVIASQHEQFQYVLKHDDPLASTLQSLTPGI